MDWPAVQQGPCPDTPRAQLSLWAAPQPTPPGPGLPTPALHGYPAVTQPCPASAGTGHQRAPGVAVEIFQG